MWDMDPHLAVKGNVFDAGMMVYSVYLGVAGRGERGFNGGAVKNVGGCARNDKLAALGIDGGKGFLRIDDEG